MGVNKMQVDLSCTEVLEQIEKLLSNIATDIEVEEELYEDGDIDEDDLIKVYEKNIKKFDQTKQLLRKVEVDMRATLYDLKHNKRSKLREEGE